MQRPLNPMAAKMAKGPRSDELVALVAACLAPKLCGEVKRGRIDSQGFHRRWPHFLLRHITHHMLLTTYDAGNPHVRFDEGGGNRASASFLLYSTDVFCRDVCDSGPTQERYNVRVPELKRYYGLSHLHYLITSIPQGGTARPCLTPSVLGSNGLQPSAGCGGN